MEKNEAANAFQQMTHQISELFMRYGIRSVTMDDLAQEMGISKKTLYHYFKDKEDLVRKVVDYHISQQEAGINQVLGNKLLNAIDQIFHMSRLIFQHLKQVTPPMLYDLKKYYPRIWSEILEFKRDTLQVNIRENLQKGISQGLYAAGQDARIIASMYTSRLEHYTLGEHDLQDLPFAEVFNSIFIYHVRGISSPKGIEYLEQLMEQSPEQLLEYHPD